MPFATQQIASPYDPDARWSTKREVEWVGDKVHLTETCDETLPHLITHVETTVATTHDGDKLRNADPLDRYWTDIQHTDHIVIRKSEKLGAVGLIKRMLQFAESRQWSFPSTDEIAARPSGRIVEPLYLAVLHLDGIVWGAALKIRCVYGTPRLFAQAIGVRR